MPAPSVTGIPPAPKITTELPGPRAKDVLAADRRFISPSYTRPYPLVAARASGVMVEDVDGNRFLDFAAGIAVAATGHCHPRVVAAIQQQAARLIHISASDFYYPNLAELAGKLAQIMPGGGENRAFFVNSGAEAVEAAIKLARRHTGRKKLIAFTGAFHGRTLGALSLTASKAVHRRGFGPLLPHVHHAPFPYCYRCPRGRDASRCCLRSLEAVEELFKALAPPDEVAAVVVEPVQGEGGYIPAPPEFLQQLRRLCDAHGILLAFDEVQCGMGRTGKMWACEHADVKPDILATAKGIASGMPLGAIIASRELMDWPPGAHASTFGGNPVSIAAALATIDLLESELLENARATGAHILERLRSWPERHPNVGDVRGMGLMIGIELIEPGPERKPASGLRDRIVQAAFRKGLLTLGCGESVLRLAPPLIITPQQADFALDTIEQCLEEAEGMESER